MAQQDKAWESAWRSAFDQRAITPPDEVWQNIESELDRNSRKKMLPVWWVAAGITIVAITGIWIHEISSGEDLSEDLIATATENNSPQASSGEKNPFPLFEGEEKENDTAHDNASVNTKKAGDVKRTDIDEISQNGKPAGSNVAFATDRKGLEEKADKSGDPVVYPVLPGLLDKIKEVSFNLQLPEIGEILGVAMPYIAKKRDTRSSWYAGVDLSAGASSLQSSEGTANAELMQSPASGFSNDFYESTQSGSQSSSFGVTVGKKLSDRIIFESGLTYLRIQNIGSSNLAYSSASGREAFNKNADLSEAVLTSTTPYEVQHVHQFISLPLKAGYLIIDNRWKMSVNGGVSGDYFFKTYTEDLSGNLNRYEATPGSDDYWNNFTMSVIGEINIARQMGRHYYIALSPQIRQAMSDLSNTGTELKPLVLQVGVQLKYKFD